VNANSTENVEESDFSAAGQGIGGQGKAIKTDLPLEADNPPMLGIL
jgi:hypothetical protein